MESKPIMMITGPDNVTPSGFKLLPESNFYNHVIPSGLENKTLHNFNHPEWRYKNCTLLSKTTPEGVA